MRCKIQIWKCICITFELQKTYAEKFELKMAVISQTHKLSEGKVKGIV